MKKKKSRPKKASEFDRISTRVAELEETLRAIRMGEVDAVVVSGPIGDQVFTLQGAEHPYRTLVETIDEGAATLSHDGTVLYSNRSFAAIFDVPLEKFIGSPIQSFVSRFSSVSPRPLLDESGLGSAVRWYAEGFQKRSGIHLTVDIATGLSRLSTDVETALFRVLQESLTNVHRYSGSPDAEIKIFAEGGQIQLEVVDHGRGIENGAGPVQIDGIAS